MKVIDYPDHEAYLRFQMGVRKGRKGPFFRPEEIEAVVKWLKGNRWTNSVHVPHSGLCHGVRCGAEVEAIGRECTKQGFDTPELIGTDLLPREDLGRTKLPIVQWDFSVQNPDWVGKFDMIYSNSLDHARDPRATLAVWMEQLSLGGRLFVQWERNHNVLKAGNCFAATLDEYVDLLEEVGRCLDVVFVPASGRCRWSAVVVGARK